MADIPEDDLEETRAALASTLDAAAAILPWLEKPRALRFPRALNERWIDACKQLAAAWSGRQSGEEHHIRPEIFSVYGIALETQDADCLRLGEALACAADHLEEENCSARLFTALSAAIECMNDPAGLEHLAFQERARHFAQRLESSSTTCKAGTDRSAVLDRLFVSEAKEHLALMQDALARLPLDAYALKTEAIELAQKAEHLELFGLMHMARQLAECMNNRLSELDSDSGREMIQAQWQSLENAISTVNG